MEEHEIPIDIYTHDLLGMEKSSWHQAEQPKVEFSEHTPLSSKQKYITILLCVGFLYFVAVGVWTIQRKVFPTNMAEVNAQVFFPKPTAPIKQVNAGYYEVRANELIFTSSHDSRIDFAPFYFRPVYRHHNYSAFSEIDRKKSRKIEEWNKRWNTSTQLNWQPFMAISVEPIFGRSYYYVR